MMQPSKIAVVNVSTLVDAASAALMVAACKLQLIDFAREWGRVPVDVELVDKLEDVPEGASVILIADDSDQADALGWHTEGPGGIPFGRVFARGLELLVGALSVSAVLAHEILELFIDPAVNAWRDDVAEEVCDPVEGDSYTVDVDGTKVAVSNGVLPAWFTEGAPGPYDLMGTTSAPFQLSPGGYVVRSDGSQTFGAKRSIVDHAARKTHPACRTQRRLSVLRARGRAA